MTTHGVAGNWSRKAPARVLIVDDHDLARAGLRMMLSSEPSITILAEASSGTEAISMCESLRPDLVLMDVRMPDMDGLSATATIKEQHPEICIIIVTMYENPDYLFQAIRAGVAGYLLKDATRQEIVTAIHQVMSGDTLLSPDFAAQVLRRISNELSREVTGIPERLTPREADVIQLVARGMTNREIADSLSISTGTAKVHVERIIAKLGVSDRTQAAVRAVEMGLVSLSPS